MAAISLNLYGPALSVEVDPRLTSAPVAITFGPGSWLALSADEAAVLGKQLQDAAASLRPADGAIQKANADLEPAGHQSLRAGEDSLGHGFDRREAA